MALEIFKLVGSIFVDSSKADESLQKTDKKAANIGQTLGKGMQTAAKWGAGIVAGAAAAVVAITKLSTKAAETADNIDKMSQKIGISKKGYQEWAYVMGQNGMEVDKLQTGIKTLIGQMDSAAAGGANASEAFNKLGLSIYDSTGNLKDQETMLRESLYALADMQDGTEKAALANQLFGRSGSEMMPMLNQGSQAMADLTQRANDLGLILGDDAVNAGVVLGDTISDIKQSFTALGTQLGATLFPVIQKVCNFILDVMPTVQAIFDGLAPIISAFMDEVVPPLMELASELLPVIFDVLMQVMPILSEIVQMIIPIIIQLLQILMPILVEVIKSVLPVVVDLLSQILPLVQPLLELLSPFFEAITPIIQVLMELINTILPPLIALFTEILNFVMPSLQRSFKLVADVLMTVFRGALEDIKGVVESVKSVLFGIIDFIKNVFTGNWQAAWNSVNQIFSGIWKGIQSTFRSLINCIINGINTFIRGINRIKIPDWVPGVDGRGFNIATIPTLAQGGVLEAGQTGFLEGNGAEAVVPLHNNQKWINAVARDMESAMGGKETATLLTAILDAVEGLTDRQIYLDTGKLVGGIAPSMDKALGRVQVAKARG